MSSHHSPQEIRLHQKCGNFNKPANTPKVLFISNREAKLVIASQPDRNRSHIVEEPSIAAGKALVACKPAPPDGAGDRRDHSSISVNRIVVIEGCARRGN